MGLNANIRELIQRLRRQEQELREGAVTSLARADSLEDVAIELEGLLAWGQQENEKEPIVTIKNAARKMSS